MNPKRLSRYSRLDKPHGWIHVSNTRLWRNNEKYRFFNKCFKFSGRSETMIKDLYRDYLILYWLDVLLVFWGTPTGFQAGPWGPNFPGVFISWYPKVPLWDLMGVRLFYISMGHLEATMALVQTWQNCLEDVLIRFKNAPVDLDQNHSLTRFPWISSARTQKLTL